MVHKTKTYVRKSEAIISIAVAHPFVIVKFQEKKALGVRYYRSKGSVWLDTSILVRKYMARERGFNFSKGKYIKETF